MTFNASVPLATDSPSIFPAQAQTNWGRLQTIIEADHQFNNTAAGTDGYHNLIHLTPQSPSGALAGYGRMYVKEVDTRMQTFYMDDSGREYQVTPGVIAAVNFNGAGAVGLQTLRSSLNVTSVDKTATGAYTVNFTTAIANTNYIVSFTCMRNSVGEGSFGCVAGNTTYSTSVGVSSIKLLTFGTGQNQQDVIMGNLLVYSLS